MNKKYGILPKSKFIPPAPNRGGGWNPEKKEEKPLTGMVQDQKAAQGEERLARTIEKGLRKGIVRKHYFRWTTLKRGTVGYKELDELVFTLSGVVAISVKGTDFVHKGESARQKDKMNELIILAQLRKLGIDVSEIKSVPADRLKTQEMADKEGRRLGVYR